VSIINIIVFICGRITYVFTKKNKRIFQENNIEKHDSGYMGGKLSHISNKFLTIKILATLLLIGIDIVML
jgi:hypothetical protein